MGLAVLIKRGVTGNVATATPATPATVSPETGPSVATVATVAVAKVSDRVLQPDLPGNQQQFADEAERRADFCNIHRTMLGGCQNFNAIERLPAGLVIDGETINHLPPGDQAKALDACLLWRLIRCGEKIERATHTEIVGGVTVADVLRWVSVNSKDLDAIRKEHRLLLTCAESLQGAGHFWEE